MRSALLIPVLSMLTAPGLLTTQAESQSLMISASVPELQLILEPGQIVAGVPTAFVFHLVNVGQTDLRIPDPNVDCGNATANGGVWLNESWQPLEGTGLGKGTGACDIWGQLPSLPVTEVAKKWHLLKPGDSLYIEANQAALHFASSAPGAYTFSAVYLPPSLSEPRIKDLENAGIAIPHRKVTSANLQYQKR